MNDALECIHNKQVNQAILLLNQSIAIKRFSSGFRCKKVLRPTIPSIACHKGHTIGCIECNVNLGN